MMKLAIDSGHEHRIGWYDPEEGEFGLMLGHSPEDLKGELPADRDLRENAIAERVAAETNPSLDRNGYYWESKAAVSAALRLCKAALIADADTRPLPEWAKTAIAAGWKAPKGWKP